MIKIICLLALLALACAQTVTPITQLGVPIKDTVVEGQLKYFTLDTNLVLQNMTDDMTLSFALTGYSGDSDLYISKTGNPTVPCADCILKSSSPRGEIKMVKKTDPEWPGADQKFYIGVHAYGGNAEFGLNVFLNRAEIKDGEPQIGDSKTGKYTYFEFTTTPGAPRNNIIVSLTPLNGDPDLYISTTNPEPTAFDHEWWAAMPGYDVINIKGDDTKYKEGKYYIGVRAFTDTYFTLSVSYNTTYTTIVEGVPMASFAAGSKTGLFKFNLLKKQKILVNTVALSYRGDPDIYVAVDVSQQIPGPNNKIASRASSGDDALVIADADPKTYYIGVRAFARDTNFQLIVASEQKNDELIDGQTQRITNNEVGYKYFRYVHSDDLSGVTFTVMPDAGVNVQLYSAMDNSRPDANKHDKQGHDMTENPNHKFIGYGYPAKIGTYYLSVYGSVGSYRIIAATNQSYTILTDSQQISGGRVPYNNYRYYIFNAGDSFKDQDFAVAVNPSQGDVDLYVSTDNPKPTRENYMWRSIGWAEDTVSIPSMDPKAGGNTTFYIAVYGASSYATNAYTIVAFMSESEQLLNDGDSVRGAVQVGKYTHYKFVVPNPSSVTLNLEMSNSNEDADIYVSTQAKPSKVAYEYRSLKYGNDVLIIDNARATTYYVAIWGERARNVTATRSISYTLSLAENYQTLTPNSIYSTIMSYTPEKKVTQFRTRISSYAKYVVVSQTLINGRTNMFVNTNTSDAVPGSSMFMVHSWPSASFLLSSDSPLFKAGQWSIGVEALQQSTYFMSVTTYPYRAYLRTGIPMVASAPRNQFMIYSYYVPYVTNATHKEDYYITPRVMNGSISVYVRYDMTEPTPQNANETWNQHDIIVLHKHKIRFGSYITVAVYGGDEDYNYYSLMLTPTNGMRLLPDDQPQEHRTIAGDYNRYEIMKPRNRLDTNVHVFISSCDVRPAPMGYLSETSARPGKHHHTATTESSHRSQYWQYVNYKSTGDNATVNVGVYSDEHRHLYTIYSTTRDHGYPLHKLADHLNGGNENGKIRITAPLATMPHRPQQHMHYSVYLFERNDTRHPNNEDPADISNMWTVCGVKRFGNLVGKVVVAQNASATFFVDVDSNKAYMVNIIAGDGLGVETSYYPGWIIGGQFYNERPFDKGMGVSVGGILLLIVGILFALYIIVGSLWNFFKNKERGIYILPHVDFWKDLPSLIWDGVKFVFTCGRRSDKYSVFDAEAGTASSYGGTGSTNQTTGAISTSNDRSSYGAI